MNRRKVFKGLAAVAAAMVAPRLRAEPKIVTLSYGDPIIELWSVETSDGGFKRITRRTSDPDVLAVDYTIDGCHILQLYHGPQSINPPAELYEMDVVAVRRYQLMKKRWALYSPSATVRV